MSSLIDEILFKPIYNLILFLIEVLPEHSLGIAIIGLTIIVRIILLIPSHKMLVQQRKMQKIQPKIKEIQKKYKEDQKKMSEEMMKLWKEEKVNPVGGCLPILLQIPFLIAIFQILRSGINEGSSHYAYAFYQNFNYEMIDHTFLGINLLQPETMFLPVIIALLQYFQVRLMFTLQHKKGNAPASKEQEMMQKMMMYLFPLMLFIMVMNFSAGLALYWGTSTVFAIFQQLLVHKLYR